MDVLVVIVLGFLVVVLALILPRLLRRSLRKSQRRDLETDIDERGRQKVLEELDAKINDKLAHIANLDANAGAIYGAGGDEMLEMEHDELRRLMTSRDIAASHQKKSK